MHVKNISLWPKLLLVSGLISIILGIFVAPEVKAASNNPTANCNATRTSCTVSFPYSGDYYIWSPPADVRTMSISLSGAQGGRSGGTGTKLNATLRTVPTTPLYIFVGGQGSSGNNAAGGFNGGGSAGAGHGDEGSGGGATDIRTGLLLTDRFAVAAGGGGTGGWVGGAGGNGNATTGGAGGNGQGTGGGGGTPSAGGAAGISYGANTSNPTAGSLGQGGNGGSANTPGSTVAGGGGGGGGYYGGGGGGADTDPVGVDGGGGGAGSSYANSSKLQSISYYTAFQVGDGQASITYNFGPSVTSFTSPVSPSNLTKPVFNLTFGQSVTGLTADAFTFSGTASGCYVSLVTGSGANYAVTVSGCSDGTMALSLKADSVMGNAIGPVRAVSTSTIILDRTLPELSALTKQPSGNDLIVYKAVFSEVISGLSADATDWLVKGDGCNLQSLIGSGSEYVITISGCLDGHLAGLVLNQLSVVDTAGNIGPSLLNQTGVTKIDTSAPIFHVIDVTDAGVGGLPTWIFDSEEPVTGMSQEKFTFFGTATGCSFSYSVLRTGLGWKVRLEGCSVGTTQVILVANSVKDTAGNVGPITALASNVVTITPDEVVNQSITPPASNNGAATGSQPKTQSSTPQESLPQGYVLPEVTQDDVMGKKVENDIPSKTQNKPVQIDLLNQQQITYGLIFLALALSAFALVGKRNPRHRR
ncbi:MAG: hypothetical protein RIQ88_67 [Actinomycetota bacterium]